jgi:putative aminopeptidase FrvX
MTIDLYKILGDLMSAPAVTGFEEPRRESIIRHYSKYCDSVSVDVIGNVIGTLGNGEKSVMLAGHYDQLGFLVTYIDEKGYAHFNPVGGWDPRVAYSTRVRIWVGDETESYVTGVIGPKPAHLTDAAEREKTVKWKDLRIDFGAGSADDAEKMGVRIGCPVTADSSLTHIGEEHGDLIMASALDDICAVGSFLVTLEELSQDPPEGVTIHAVATVQEEIGLRGAAVSGYNLNPWCAIAVDVTHAVAPGVDAPRVGGIELGKGPVISYGANFTRSLWEMMEESAKTNGIPYQREAVPSRSGTDAWALQILRGGTISGLISVPNRYMHSPNEVVSLSDLENIGKLLAATVKTLSRSNLRHTEEVFRKH